MQKNGYRISLFSASSLSKHKYDIKVEGGLLKKRREEEQERMGAEKQSQGCDIYVQTAILKATTLYAN